jgi:hypothetical protein
VRGDKKPIKQEKQPYNEKNPLLLLEVTDFLYLYNIQFGEVGEPSGPASLFLLEIESFYFKSFCAIDNTNYMA